MTFDGVTLRALLGELRQTLPGGRVQRVYQPGPHEVTLHFTGAVLLISCNPAYSRAHLTYRKRPNPPQPPPFCMLLRKHLEGSRLLSCDQEGLERVLTLTFRGTDEAGAPYHRRLVAELMGKHSNLVLLDERGTIIDALKRLPATASRRRETLPGRPYVAPPATGKLALLRETPAGPVPAAAPDLEAALRDRLADEPAARQPRPAPLYRSLAAAVEGIGPERARQILQRAGIDADGAGVPDGGAGVLTPHALRELAEALARLAAEAGAGRLAPPSHLLDDAYAEAEAAARFEQEKNALARAVSTALARARRRLAAQEEEKRQAESAEEYRAIGELLTAHLKLMRPGQAEVSVTDYFDPAQPLRTIRLDPSLSPAANAQAYFRRYRKARRLGGLVDEKLASTRDEIAYLEGVETALANALAAEDLAGIGGELASQGYVKDPRGRKGTAGRGTTGPTGPAAVGEPLRFTSSDGWQILVGRHNRQNEHLLRHVARPGDAWLHARQIPGSHVIIRCDVRQGAAQDTLDAIPARTLHEAALLAAHYSRARGTPGTPVDYTLRRHVRKPPGSRPGMVTYENHRTIYVSPGEEELRRLLAFGGRGEPEREEEPRERG